MCFMILMIICRGQIYMRWNISVVLQVFWHLEENPKMKDVKFQRGDVVEFEVYRDMSRGDKTQSRARNMPLVGVQTGFDSKEQRSKTKKKARIWR